MTNASDSWTQAAAKFGDHLRQLRKRAGLMQEALGQKVGLSKSRISEIEGGKFRTPLDRDVVTAWAKECIQRAPKAPGGPSWLLAMDWWTAELERLMRLHDQLRDGQHDVSAGQAASVPQRAAGLLASYLKAARREAEKHPYLGIRCGDAPPLFEIYRPQFVRLRASGSPGPAPQRGDNHVGPLVPADEVLTNGSPICTVLGAPGVGKSSLLRRQMDTVISRLDDGPKEVEVPVLLPAVEWTGGLRLADALARYTNRELTPYGLSQDLDAGFFADRPRPGAAWLVLIDGLDEVVDAEQRQRILGAVATALADAHGLYRFVVTSRPLPDCELNRVGRLAPRYELEPFTPQDLPVFAESWFAAQQLAAPANLAQLFISALQRIGVADLARTPLMATMLCQLFADNPDEPLPASRGAIYGRFADLLQMRQYQPAPEKQAVRALDRYGKAACERGRDIIGALPRLVRYLAHQWHSGNRNSALRILANHPDVQRPEAVPQLEWEGFLTSCLRGSGILTSHAGNFAFLHQTFLEHFAACHATQDGEAQAHTFSRLFNDPEITQLLSTGSTSRSDVWDRTYWELMRLGVSYFGFLLDAAPDEDAIRVLSSLITVGGPDGCEIIAGLAQVGTRVPVPIIDAAAATLVDSACDTTSISGARVHAARTLCELDAARGTDLLASLAQEARLGIDPAEIDDILDEGEDLGSVLVDPNDARVTAAEYLAELGDARGADCLHSLAGDNALHSMFRIEAAQRLKGLGDARTADLLHSLVWDPTLDAPDRITAAASLEALDSQRGIGVLRGLAWDNRFPPFNRLVAAWYLAQFDEGTIADLLDDLAGDTSLPPDHRLQTTRWLSELGDGRAAHHLDDLPPGTHLGSLESDFPKLRVGRRSVGRVEADDG
ncbi:helix-turn-helix domain-containing protein (plasmid) [Streptomyces albidoflavus]|uniref:helix-turn-helix domain-containing protein n=1 Tax=Streptomyces albidoflavus TaxID=1886 RepID=UPI002F9185CF|nr:helix-turn-helix domain-containing protein [Streptomyces albidoflavus]